MKYILLTSEFLGSGLAARSLVDALPEHQLLGVCVSAARRNGAYIHGVIRRSGLRCAAYYLAVGYLYQYVQFGIARVLQMRGRPRRPLTLAALTSQLRVPLIYVGDLRDPRVLSCAERLAPDLFVSVLFEQRLPASLLRVPRYGSVNVHPSLLPEFAGRAPAIMALAAGRETIGVTLHLMNEELDAGAILAQHTISVGERDTVLTAQVKLVRRGMEALPAVMRDLASGNMVSWPQDLMKRSYFSEPDRRTMRELRRRGRRLFRIGEYLRLCADTLGP
jgi:hypothetical protein